MNFVSRRLCPVSAARRGPMEILIYAANGLYLLSYTVKDILKLRLLTISAACILVAYFALQPEPVMSIICWNLFFVALNIFQIVSILKARLIIWNVAAS
jgi:hypothetical protein